LWVETVGGAPRSQPFLVYIQACRKHNRADLLALSAPGALVDIDVASLVAHGDLEAPGLSVNT
jgi:hypothetical protein